MLVLVNINFDEGILFVKIGHCPLQLRCSNSKSLKIPVSPPGVSLISGTQGGGITAKELTRVGGLFTKSNSKDTSIAF